MEQPQLQRHQVRIRYLPEHQTYHYFIPGSDHISEPISREVIDHPERNDKAKDQFFQGLFAPAITDIKSPTEQPNMTITDV